MKVQTVQLGFSTPCRTNDVFPNVDHNSLSLTPAAQKDTAAKQKQLPWTSEEDKLLIAGYLRVSRDTFAGAPSWIKVVNYYNENRGFNIDRNQKSCERRWGLINSAVSKFQEFYDQAEALKKSHGIQSDIFLAAHETYETEMKKKFNLHHAWHMLKDDPRWKRHKSYNYLKITKINEQPSYVSSPDQDTPSSSNVRDETVVPTPPSIDVTPPSIDVKGAKRKNEDLANPISDLPECILDAFPKAADSEEKMSMIKKLVESQTRMAQALEENARAKKYKMFLELEQRRTLSTRENAISEQLYAELFPN